MTTLTARIEGIALWTRGLPTWGDAVAHARGGAMPGDAPTRPSPQLLAPNERRRAPETVAVALEVALAACQAAGRDPASLPSVFASTHGELGITDYMCRTLATEPRTISPTRFHNSVHNAAAGYWTIGAGAMAAATAISALHASFAQGLLEALAQLADGAPAVLLVGYDGASAGPLAGVTPSEGLLGGALVLARDPSGGRDPMTLAATLGDGDAPANDGPLARLAAGNAMATMLPLFDALAAGHASAVLDAGPGRVLQLSLVPAPATRTVTDESLHA
ncbi:beta-ketoacyl synthase chain length factor [Lysobacter sp. A3-1-A15]|uniref:beta-ketoacyl synthase chain length factor n=2 Tax=Novilysobacter viscosus TaxID=3098602 RepID=UPI003983C7C0